MYCYRLKTPGYWLQLPVAGYRPGGGGRAALVIGTDNRHREGAHSLRVAVVSHIGWLCPLVCAADHAIFGLIAVLSRFSDGAVLNHKITIV